MISVNGSARKYADYSGEKKDVRMRGCADEGII
jgi:hypothetical protein